MSHDPYLIDVALGKDARRRKDSTGGVAASSGASADPASSFDPVSSSGSGFARKRWVLGLLVLSVIYLLFEMIFNASLVQVAGSGHSTEDELTRTELLGRSLSGIGVSLLFAGWALRGPLLSSRARRWTTAGLIFLITWPLVFFGQRVLIDQYLIEPSSAEQRQRAYYAQLVRQGLATNSIEVEGIAHNPDEAYSGESLTFIALFGALLYADGDLIGKVETHTQAMVRKMVTDAAYRDFPDHYERYQTFRVKLQDDYRRYAEASNTLNTRKTASSQEADKAWQQIDQEISKGWQEYQDGVAQFDRQVSLKAEQLTPRLKEYFDRVSQCQSDACLRPYNERYAREISQLGVGYIEPVYWLLEEKVSTTEKVASSLLAGVLTGGISLAIQGLNLATGGDGGLDKSRFYFLNNTQDVAERLSLKLQPTFADKAKGYRYNLANYEAFRNDFITVQQVIQSSRKKGINLPDSWTLSDRATFDRLVDQKIVSEADSSWKRQSQNQGLNLPPNLSWDQFQLRPEVQRLIRDEMGAALYVNPMRADWNNRQFLQRVVEPNIERKTGEIIGQLRRESAEYEDGGSMAETSKSALRAILVPPISMGLSLLLIVLTLCNLPVRIWKEFSPQLAREKRGVDDQRRTLSATSLLLTLLPPVLVVTVPLLFFSNSYLSPQHDEDPSKPQVLHYFMDQVSGQASPLAALGLRWVMAAQPRFQPLGSALNDNTRLLDHFAPISELLHRLDDHFFSIHYASIRHSSIHHEDF